ncbi:hypothetical protein [Aliikangiella sp. G2MR2-5]|uniref:hypothetical protein n=1 Tax=Aliikangiella sp. G2MR2-5 TaxID=2788943 RepID=UPI0018AA01EB|nr:hypothetical protein [Aliikangiella sp. G2MR2-5]
MNRNQLLAISLLVVTGGYFYFNQVPDVVSYADETAADTPTQEKPDSDTEPYASVKLEQGIEAADQSIENSKEDFFASGYRAFINAKENFFSDFASQIESDSVLNEYLKDGKFNDLYIEALAHLESPESHFYLNITKSRCDILGMFGQNSHGEDIEQVISSAGVAVTEGDRQFYRGAAQAQQEFAENITRECDQITDLHQNNQQIIQSSFQSLFQQDSFQSLMDNLDEADSPVEEVSQAFNLDFTPTMQQQIAAEMKIIKKGDNEKKEGFSTLLQLAKEDHTNYLRNKQCNFDSSCKDLIGEKEYRHYINEGAYLGDHGTLSTYINDLEKSGHAQDAIAWSLYNQQLIRSGCTNQDIVTKDIMLKKSIKRRLELLNDDEKKSVNAKFEDLMEKHFDNAKAVIGC